MSLVSAFFTAQAKASVPPPAVPPVLHISRPQVSLVTSPLPTPAAELPRFLEDFCRVKGIDIIGHSAAFEAAALSPDLFPHLTVARIIEITSLPEGHAIKLQIFAQQWSASLEAARLADSSF